MIDARTKEFIRNVGRSYASTMVALGNDEAIDAETLEAFIEDMRSILPHLETILDEMTDKD